jgi:hypothetical protein
MVWRAALVVVAAAAALVPIPASSVERFYSNGAYRALQPALTSLSNRTSFALFDALLLGVATLWLAQSVRVAAHRGAVSKKIAVILWHSLVWSAALYVAFLCLWGFNYRRVPLADKLVFRSDTVTDDAARAMADAAVDQMNLLYEAAQADDAASEEAVHASLAAAFRHAADLVGIPAGHVPARPKRSLLDWYFRRAAVSGMTNPYFLEILVASDVLPFERPFVVAHEWSHLAGIANEGDANFVGWLACVRASPGARYSGWLFLYQELAGSLNRSDQRAVAARLGPGPLADLRASRERMLKNVSPRLAAAGWRVYDSYLKANRIQAGAASYAEVVRLVLGAEFRANWTPVLRGD